MSGTPGTVSFSSVPGDEALERQQLGEKWTVGGRQDPVEEPPDRILVGVVRLHPAAVHLRLADRLQGPALDPLPQLAQGVRVDGRVRPDPDQGLVDRVLVIP
jgi:hypothetical protein